MGNSDSWGETSPRSDRKGAPNRWRAVGELSSLISQLTCSAMSSRLRSKSFVSCIPNYSQYTILQRNAQCSCFPVREWPGGGISDLLRFRMGRDAEPFGPEAASAWAPTFSPPATAGASCAGSCELIGKYCVSQAQRLQCQVCGGKEEGCEAGRTEVGGSSSRKPISDAGQRSCQG